MFNESKDLINKCCTHKNYQTYHTVHTILQMRKFYSILYKIIVMSILFIWTRTWWRHQMETFSALLALCAGNSPVNSPHKGQWCRALMFSLICTWINAWVNNHDSGDRYDVIVMIIHEIYVVGMKVVITFNFQNVYLAAVGNFHLSQLPGSDPQMYDNNMSPRTEINRWYRGYLTSEHHLYMAVI